MKRTIGNMFGFLKGSQNTTSIETPKEPTSGNDSGQKQGDNMSAEETRQKLIDTVQTLSLQMMTEKEAEVRATLPVTPTPVEPGQPVPTPVDMISKDEALKMVQEAGDKRYAEGYGAGTEDKLKTFTTATKAAESILDAALAPAASVDAPKAIVK